RETHEMNTRRTNRNGGSTPPEGGPGHVPSVSSRFDFRVFRGEPSERQLKPRSVSAIIYRWLDGVIRVWNGGTTSGGCLATSSGLRSSQGRQSADERRETERGAIDPRVSVRSG